MNAYLRPDATPNHHKSYGYLRTPEFSRIACAYVDMQPDRSVAPPECPLTAEARQPAGPGAASFPGFHAPGIQAC